MLKWKLYFLRILQVSVQFLGWGNSGLLTTCQQLVVLLSRALSNGPNVYLKINAVCYVKKINTLSVDLNGSEMSINKELFKVALLCADFSKALFSSPIAIGNWKGVLILQTTL